MPANNIQNKSFFDIQNTAFICAVIAAVTFAAYLPVWNNEFISYDDPHYVTQNRNVTSGITLKNISWAFTSTQYSNWHPLTWLSHMIDCQFFGVDPAWHHMTSLLLHIINSLLLLIVFKQMTGRLWPSSFIAALFALHPLHVESVVWAAERKDVLSTFFWMLTLWSYNRYVMHKTIGRYLATLLFFIMGLMAKPMVVTLPFVLLLLDVWPLKRITFSSSEKIKMHHLIRLLYEKTPFFIFTAVSCVGTFMVQKKSGAVAALDSFALTSRIANTLLSYIKYMGKIIYPDNLAVYYPRIDSFPFWQTMAACLLLLFISILVIMLLRRLPSLAAGWFWYLGTLVPVVGLVQVGRQAMADRYTYIPSIGLFIAAAWGILYLFEKGYIKKSVIVILSAVFLLLVTVKTFKQVAYWENDISLFRHAIDVTDNNFIAHTNLASALLMKDKIEEAAEHYRKALRLRPGNEKANTGIGNAMLKQDRLSEAILYYSKALRTRPRYAEAHFRMGMALSKQGKTDEAIHHYSRAITISPKKAEAYMYLGISQFKKGSFNEAAENFYEALRLMPNSLEARSRLGEALIRLGKTDEAVQHYYKALERDPGNDVIHANLGNIFSASGKLDKSVQHYAKALKINPDLAEVHIGMGDVLSMQDNMAEAAKHYAEALRISPENEAVYMRMGSVCATTDKLDEAVKYYSEALRLNPGNPQAHTFIGDVLRMLGRADESVVHYMEALRIKPDSSRAHTGLGDIFIARCRLHDAVDHYAKALHITPDDAYLHNNLAWIYATSRDSQLRNPEKAVTLAEQACSISDHKDPGFLDTLAAAYAGSGRFGDALKTAEKALKTALSADNKKFAENIKKRMDLYKSNLPFYKDCIEQ